MDENELKKLMEIKELDEFINLISPYYPDLTERNFNIKKIETILYNTYLKLIGKILYHTPEVLRNFINVLLLKYEIKNIKNIILGAMVESDKTEILDNIYLLAEDYLGRREFINELLDKTNLDEIQYFLKNSRYYETIREGINYFKKYNEVFILKAFMDQIYYKNLIAVKNKMKKRESEIINPYIDYTTELYNLTIISRGINNKLNSDLIKQLLVENYLFLNKQKMKFLLKSDTGVDISTKIRNILSKERRLKSINQRDYSDIKHPIKSIEYTYMNFLLRYLKSIPGNIESLTILRILELIIKKEYEIRNYILPQAIRINQLKNSRLNIIYNR